VKPEDVVRKLAGKPINLNDLVRSDAAPFTVLGQNVPGGAHHGHSTIGLDYDPAVGPEHKAISSGGEIWQPGGFYYSSRTRKQKMPRNR
jgi:hypothetical protein